MNGEPILYSIPRVKKLNRQSVVKACPHNTRKMKVPNADGTKRIEQIPVKENGSVPTSSYLTLIKQKLNPLCLSTKRKNAILAIEVLLTASPKFFSEDKRYRFDIDDNCDKNKFEEWKRLTVDWVRNRFQDTIIDMSLHLDESTPHIHVIFVPLITKQVRVPCGYKKTELKTEVRLCASDLVKRKWLYSLHDDYSKLLQCLGLSRGVIHSQAKHNEIKANGMLQMENERLRAERDLLVKQCESLRAELKTKQELATKILHLKSEASSYEQKSTEARASLDNYSRAVFDMKHKIGALSSLKNQGLSELKLQRKSIAESEFKLAQLYNEINSLKKIRDDAQVASNESLNTIRTQFELINSASRNAVKLLSLVDGFSELLIKEQLAKDICKSFENVLAEMKGNLGVFLEHNKSIDVERSVSFASSTPGTRKPNKLQSDNALYSSMPQKNLR
ncbi:MobV family relaxase [Glaciecola sp. SC05]|uniref:MobV family relaxase n=1 Tax=Glaciecola sp. SC05 TaxID=1987355 RepID=UPI003527B4F1